MTTAEYLRVEQLSEFRHEYWNGQVREMEGATPRHSDVTLGFIGALRSRLSGDRYGLFNCLLRVRDSKEGLYTYPDVSVTCGEPIVSNGDTLVNPLLLAEVLSPTTEDWDRGLKFERYRLIGSLREYVLLSQEEPRVETFQRQADGSWRREVFCGMESAVALKSLDIEVPLEEIYA